MKDSIYLLPSAGCPTAQLRVSSRFRLVIKRDYSDQLSHSRAVDHPSKRLKVYQ